jgi:hypothetical protein
MVLGRLGINRLILVWRECCEGSELTSYDHFVYSIEVFPGSQGYCDCLDIVTSYFKIRRSLQTLCLQTMPYIRTRNSEPGMQ